MLTPEYLRSKFESALSYADYVATGKPEHQVSWGEQRALLRGELHAL
ncbi:MAG: hypothetical protein AAGK04_12130 [Planctomycetota bacterium]